MHTGTIENLRIDQLQPWPRNARTHSRKQIKQIAESPRRIRPVDAHACASSIPSIATAFSSVWELFARDDAELIACGRFGGPANDVVVDEQAVEKQTFQEKNKEIPTAPKRKLRAKAGNGDLETEANSMLGGSSFGSRRPRRASF